jgi:hypothetical protein
MHIWIKEKRKEKKKRNDKSVKTSSICRDNGGIYDKQWYIDLGSAQKFKLSCIKYKLYFNGP